MGSSMKVTLWGVRGSVPSPDPTTVRYGGNTACVSVELDDGILILDAGTGIRPLGKELMGGDIPIYVLITHNHWDHIQGFPFFPPIYQPHRTIYIFPFKRRQQTMCSLLEQMDGAHFPVTPEELMSNYECILDDPLEFLHRQGFDLSQIATNHPGGCDGYRLQHEGKSLVYIPDNELDPPYAKETEFDGFVQFCKGADVLIHDAQYLEQDMPAKHGWGHSLIGQACDLAAAAQVEQLILFHHDPDRSDDELDAIQKEARDWFNRNGHATRCTVAYEGLTFDF